MKLKAEIMDTIITAEQKYFIQLLKDYVHQTESKEPEPGFRWMKLYQIAKDQDLRGIVYVQCRNMKSIHKNILKLLSKGFMSDAYLSVNTDYAMKEVTDLFDKNEIEYLPFKGSVIREYYPVRELRTMGDRDILIHQSDCDKADQIMRDLGYDRMIDNHAVWTYTKPYLMFEIHNVMFYDPLPNQVDYRTYFNRIWETAVKADNGFEYTPDKKTHFLYMIAHTAKHITNHGIGFRAFLDLCFFCKNELPCSEYKQEWEWIEKELRTLELYDFTAVCFTLISQWFETDMPFINRERISLPIERIEEKVFKDGLFGLTNDDNTGAHTAMEIRRNSHQYFLTSVIVTLRKIIPPYRDMQLISWYSWVDGKPWLMPAAWVYRWFYCLIHKFKWSINLLTEPINKKEQILKRDKYLDIWRL